MNAKKCRISIYFQNTDKNMKLRTANQIKHYNKITKKKVEYQHQFKKHK